MENVKFWVASVDCSWNKPITCSFIINIVFSATVSKTLTSAKHKTKFERRYGDPVFYAELYMK